MTVCREDSERQPKQIIASRPLCVGMTASVSLERTVEDSERHRGKSSRCASCVSGGQRASARKKSQRDVPCVSTGQRQRTIVEVCLLCAGRTAIVSRRKIVEVCALCVGSRTASISRGNNAEVCPLCVGRTASVSRKKLSTFETIHIDDKKQASLWFIANQPRLFPNMPAWQGVSAGENRRGVPLVYRQNSERQPAKIDEVQATAGKIVEVCLCSFARWQDSERHPGKNRRGVPLCAHRTAIVSRGKIADRRRLRPYINDK
uniref:Uncharacterized protein n=1 Tax=Branchiostoma floridae TaxID=7739 RepID=C3YBC0_BRAFL|eukprot:XP_002606267.1 hypothetical protein BRAFLDRAFT_83981 [Branchiostoma floridae]